MIYNQKCNINEYWIFCIGRANHFSESVGAEEEPSAGACAEIIMREMSINLRFHGTNSARITKAY